jgi:phosphohistidine swiveling domain-containing protein
VERDGRFVLLQSRPITTIGDQAEADGPVFGPGPLAETFPTALAPLEEDLWIPPLRDGLRHALSLLGSAPAAKLRKSPVVVTVDGRPAVDLDLLGLAPTRRSRLAWLDPRPPARRLLAAWRVGRLRAALPALAQDVLDEVDAELRAIPALGSLTPVGLLRLLERSAGVLRSLHGYEVLAGQLLDTDTDAPTAASRALTVLAEARASRPEVSDEQLLAEEPVLLSLLPPAIAAPRPLPVAPALVPGAARETDDQPSNDPTTDSAATRREALRLRARWVQELTARASLVLGDELVQRGVLRRPEEVRQLRLDDLPRVLAGELTEVSAAAGGLSDAPLPRAFRQADGVIVPVVVPGENRGGRGAGGGRGMGRVHHGDGAPPPGSVLVVSTLDPSLAPHLPGLSGLVSETGSTLSHLAILAREYGIPTVVDLAGARERFPDGSWVVVDGATGEVAAVSSEEWRAA